MIFKAVVIPCTERMMRQQHAIKNKSEISRITRCGGFSLKFMSEHRLPRLTLVTH